MTEPKACTEMRVQRQHRSVLNL